MKLNKKGFTLIELLGVITIIAILAAFVIPNVFDMMDKGKAKTYDVLKDNVLIAAENYVTECSSNGNLYQVYIPSANTTIGAITTLYQSVNNKLTTDDICKTNSISSCMASTVINEGKQVLIPFKCTKIETSKTLTALELASNGFLKASTDENKNKVIPRATDDKDVSSCLEVIVTYDASTYSYSYQIDDRKCD